MQVDGEYSRESQWPLPDNAVDDLDFAQRGDISDDDLLAMFDIMVGAATELQISPLTDDVLANYTGEEKFDNKLSIRRWAARS